MAGKSSEGFGGRYSNIVPETEAKNPNEDTGNGRISGVNFNKAKNPGDKVSKIRGIILVILIIADIIILRDYIWPILFLGVIFLLFAAGNS